MATRLQKLYARRSDGFTFDSTVLAKAATESYRDIYESETVKYVVGCMQVIPETYTKKSYEEANRIKNQLENQLTHPCEFDYQGSVTNDTHIKYHSDIDLLLITKKFESLERPQQPQYPYVGNVLSDLQDLRDQAITILKKAFYTADVDASGAKCITIKGGSLQRKIDVVPSNWYNTNDYSRTNDKTYRGIHVFDSRNQQRILNTPFLHNYYIAQKDAQTNGGMRKATRLLKSIKADSEVINLSSFDIASIVYNIPNESLFYTKHRDLRIFSAVLLYVSELTTNSTLRASLSVPDGHRKIFTDGHATIQDLNLLLSELVRINQEILNENRVKFNNLNEAVIAGFNG